MNTPMSCCPDVNGIPVWMAILALAAVIVLSHVFLYYKKEPTQGYRRWNMFQMSWFKKLVKIPYFPMMMQIFSMLLLILVFATGLFGNPRGNISTILTWTWWWILLIFIIAGVGKGFCVICPWEGFSSLFTSLSLKSRVKKIGFELKWPEFARNLYPAIILFILLTWIELGYGVTKSPVLTASLGLIMTTMAIVSAMVFEKRGFCRYACLVGRISGIYAMFSPVEIRSESYDVCRTCTTKDCVKGREETGATGCSLGLFPGYLQENTYCTLCTECIRACPHDNLNINVRPLGTDLLKKTKYRWDEASLAIILLALTSFHGLTMTPQWLRMNNLIRANTGLGQLMLFSILMVVCIVIPLLIFWIGAGVSSKLAQNKISQAKIFKAFAYSLIPVALFYHLAHNGMHFFMEAQNILPFISDPFGYGWDLFGTASKEYLPLLSLTAIWWIQVVLIVIGHVYGVVIADRMAKKIFTEGKTAMRCLIPLVVTMILYSGFSIWLIAQPMGMRTAM